MLARNYENVENAGSEGRGPIFVNVDGSRRIRDLYRNVMKWIAFEKCFPTAGGGGGSKRKIWIPIAFNEQEKPEGELAESEAKSNEWKEINECEF